MKVLRGAFFGLLLSVCCFPALQAQHQLKIMSYNIHHANPPSKPGLIDIDAIAQVIKKENPDIVALQEVDVHTGRSGDINEAVQLALKTGLKSFFFAKAIDHDGGHYGVAILSKHPLSATQTHRLPMDSSTKGEPRVLATATVSLPGGRKLIIGSTHLDAQRAPTNRRLQIAAIDRLAAGIDEPFIIAGDFNAEENTDVIQKLDQQFTRTCSNCAPTIPVVQPKRTIDFIAYRPRDKFKVLKHEVIQETYASDHLPVTAILVID